MVPKRRISPASGASSSLTPPPTAERTETKKRKTSSGAISVPGPSFEGNTAALPSPNSKSKQPAGHNSRKTFQSKRLEAARDEPGPERNKDTNATPESEEKTALGSKPKTQSKSRPQTRHEPTDEFQQVSRAEFVDRYKVEGMGYGGDVYYQPGFIQEDEAKRWYDELLELDTYQPTLKMYGRTFPQSRQIAAYSTTPSATLSYSGSDIVMHHPLPPSLERIRLKLEDDLGVRFNHVMLNRYDDGSVYIGKHSDNLNNLVIASVSLGAERKFIMSPRLPSKTRKSDAPLDNQDATSLEERKSIKCVLGNGSLVVMQGRTQEYWKHEIPKELSIKEGRISLTFRQLV